jgi:hypothetical protein
MSLARPRPLVERPASRHALPTDSSAVANRVGAATGRSPRRSRSSRWRSACEAAAHAQPTRPRSVLVAATLGLVTACTAPPVATPTVSTLQDTPFRVEPDHKVDVLFMVDNSSSMEPMQAQLRARFPQFLQLFDDLAAQGFKTDLHIGVVTSDYGAGSSDGPRSPNQPFCGRSPGGDLARLQRKGRAAVDCQGLPDDGPPYIAYAYGGGNNLPPGQSLADTFTCMASVGALGCGFEHPLESVYQALQHPENDGGFLRDDALLAVVFVTNEDDGSAPPDTQIYSTDERFGPYDTYRQTRYGVVCGSPAMLAPATAPGGPLHACAPAPNTPSLMVGGEYDVQRYKALFTQPRGQGGVKRDPRNEVLLFAIDGPDEPFEIVDVQTPLTPDARYVPCGGARDCVTRLQRSCINATDAGFFADPAVRLNDVVRAAPAFSIASICGPDLESPPDFTAALHKLADDIITHLPGCIPAPLPDVAHPECVVVQHTSTDQGDQTAVIPSCATSAGHFPCWRVAPNSLCTAAQGQALSVDRNGAPTPTGSHLQVECKTQP